MTLQVCPLAQTPRPLPTAEIPGKPAKTLDVEVQLTDPSGARGQPASVAALTHWPEMLTANVPTGTAATAAEVKQVQDIMGAMYACINRSDGFKNIAGFFSDDFYRRGIAVIYPNYGYMTPWFGLEQQIHYGKLTSAGRSQRWSNRRPIHAF